MWILHCVVAWLLFFDDVTCSGEKDEEEGHYTNEFAVEIKGGIEEVRKVALEHGMEIVKHVSQAVSFSCSLSADVSSAIRGRCLLEGA